MTFKETEDMLKSLRAMGARVALHRNRIRCIESDFSCINSALGNNGTSRLTLSGNPRIEGLVQKLYKEQELHTKALEELFKLEDELSEAISLLSTEEQDVIIGMYMDGCPVHKLVRKLYIGQKTIYRRRNSAINKISKQLSKKEKQNER